MSAEILARFLAKTGDGGPGECWTWTASKSTKGYGHMGIGRKLVAAHRLAYRAFVGPIPDGLQLDHLCRNRACVNPTHLEPVTSAENTRRGEGGMYWAGKTHCPRGHAYDETNTARGVVRSRYGTYTARKCRACGRAATAAWYRKKVSR